MSQSSGFYAFYGPIQTRRVVELRYAEEALQQHLSSVRRVFTRGEGSGEGLRPFIFCKAISAITSRCTNHLLLLLPYFAVVMSSGALFGYGFTFRTGFVDAVNGTWTWIFFDRAIADFFFHFFEV